MNIPSLIRLWPLALLLISPLPALAIDSAVPVPEHELEWVTLSFPLASPLFSATPVAVVNDEPITVEDLTRVIFTVHEDVGKPGSVPSRPMKYTELLNRLITSRLLIEEARNMGMDSLPMVQEGVKDFSEKTLRVMLLDRHVKSLGLKPDQKEVTRLYRRVSQEYRISSVLFKTQADAASMVEDLKSGTEFDVAAERAVSKGLAQRDIGDQSFVAASSLAPAVAQAVLTMKNGDVSPVISVSAGYAVFRIEDTRDTENREQRAQVEQIVLNQQRREAAEEYGESLKKKYATINEGLFDSLDFDAKTPGLAELKKDSRTLVAFKGKGNPPITVGKLAEALEAKFFHGAERAALSGKINREKRNALEELMFKKLLKMEAVRQGIDQEDEFLYEVREHENGILFDLFIKRVVVPDVKISNEEVEAYYKAHLEDYTSPPMVRLGSLVFRDRNSADYARDRLSQGADFRWVSANSEGLVNPETEGVLQFGDGLITLNNLPDGVQKALAGAETGATRLYQSPEGFYYVLYVREMLPSANRPLEDVKKAVAEKIMDQKVADSIEDWARKLREHYDVRIYVTEPVGTAENAR